MKNKTVQILESSTFWPLSETER